MRKFHPVYLFLALPFACLLWVPLYNRIEPALFGIPFFYWYQMLWVFIDARLLWIVYAIIRREDDRRRAAVADYVRDGEGLRGIPAQGYLTRRQICV